MNQVGNFLLVPSMNCPASCSYCFGPNSDSPVMTEEVLEEVIDWMRHIYSANSINTLKITFHGGEPLTAGIRYYEKALSLNSRTFAEVDFSIISNLWLIDDDFIQLFKDYKVSVAVSIDGPKSLTDRQRGAGYFENTMQGIERCRAAGISPLCLCTITADTVDHLEEIHRFFINEGLNYQVKPLSPGLDDDARKYLLTDEQHRWMIKTLVDIYLSQKSPQFNPAVHSIIHSVIFRQGGLYIPGNCSGRQLAVGPDGHIYLCQRFVGKPQYSLGSVRSTPSFEEVMDSPAGRKIRERTAQLQSRCSSCPIFSVCSGGCIYNGVAGNTTCQEDFFCSAYKNIISDADSTVLNVIRNAKGPFANEEDDFRYRKLLGIIKSGRK